MLGPVLVKYRTGFGEREVYGQLDASRDPDLLIVYAPYIVSYSPEGVRTLHVNHSVYHPLPINAERIIEIKILSDADHITYSTVLKGRHTVH